MELATTITVRGPAGDEILELDEFEARVESGAVDPATEVCFPPVTGERFVRAGELEAFRSLYEPRALYFSRAFNLGRIPWITLAASLACLGLFLLQPRSGPVDVGTLVAFGAKAGPLVRDLGEFWRLLTANFVHRDWAHLAFNLFVLFHFGAALEIAYRPLDYLHVWVASALGTTLLSWAATDAISAGASGVAFGMLGGVAVFGLKYWRILPDRYRAVLGPAVLPTVLVFLYIGFTSSGVDNWGHVGGLLAGAAATVPLRPRLLGNRPSLRRRLLTRVAPIALVVGAAILAGPLLGDRLPRVEPRRLEHLALEIPVPEGWVSTSPSSFSNGLPMPARASVSAGARLLPALPDLEAEARRWVAEEERRLGAEGVFARFSEPREGRVAGLPGVEVDARIRTERGESRISARFFSRGRLLYSLVLARPDRLPAYQRVLDRIVAGVRPVEAGWGEGM